MKNANWVSFTAAQHSSLCLWRGWAETKLTSESECVTRVHLPSVCQHVSSRTPVQHVMKLIHFLECYNVMFNTQGWSVTMVTRQEADVTLSIWLIQESTDGGYCNKGNLGWWQDGRYKRRGEFLFGKKKAHREIEAEIIISETENYGQHLDPGLFQTGVHVFGYLWGYYRRPAPCSPGSSLLCVPWSTWSGSIAEWPAANAVTQARSWQKDGKHPH